MRKHAWIIAITLGLFGCEPIDPMSPGLCIGSVCIDGEVSETTQFAPFEWPSDQLHINAEEEAEEPGDEPEGKTPEPDTTFGNNPETQPFVDATFETCFDLVPCMNACNTLGSDTGCVEECVKRATEVAMFSWNALNKCTTTLCGQYVGEKFETCLFLNCAEPAGACYLNGESTCAETLHCTAECGDAEECKGLCSQEMSPDAYVHQSDLTSCWTEICMAEGWLCHMSQLFVCAPEASTCGLFNENGHGCADAVSCVVSCTTGPCLLDCMGATNPASAALAGDYLLCLHSECGDKPDNGCIQKAKSGVCAEVVQSCASDE
jgi:hypothetical protein